MLTTRIERNKRTNLHRGKEATIRDFETFEYRHKMTFLKKEEGEENLDERKMVINAGLKVNVREDIKDNVINIT